MAAKVMTRDELIKRLREYAGGESACDRFSGDDAFLCLYCTMTYGQHLAKAAAEEIDRLTRVKEAGGVKQPTEDEAAALDQVVENNPNRPTSYENPALLRLLGTIFIPEGRATWDALVPERYKSPTEPPDYDVLYFETDGDPGDENPDIIIMQNVVIRNRG